MNISTLYIDATEEITSVIEKLKSTHEPIVALVVPKGAALTQSIVNLKLARKAAQDAGKDLILVTADNIAQNLANQIGIAFAKNEKELPKVAAGEAGASEAESATVVAGVRIHRYYTDTDEDAADLTETSTQAQSDPIAEPIVPKKILKEEPEKTPTPATSAPIKEERLTRKRLDTTPTETTPAPVSPEEEDTEEQEQENSVEAVAPVTALGKQPGKQPPKPRHKGGRKRWLIPLIAGLSLLVIAAGATMFLFFPASTIAVTLETQPWQQELSFNLVAADTAPEESSTTLEYESPTAEGEEVLEFTATGTKTVGEAATGSATIFNSQDSDSQVLPAGARIQANGRYFRTTAAVTVPGVTVKSGQLIPGSASVGVTAEAIGPESNMSGITGNIVSPQTSLYAQIDKTEGGTSQEVKVVSINDIQKAKLAAEEALRAKLAITLTESIAGREYVELTEDAVFTETSFTTSVAADGEAETATATLKGTLARQILADDTAGVTMRAAFAALPTDDGERIVEDVQVANIATAEDGSQTVTVLGSGKLSPIFDDSGLKETLAGRSVEAVRVYIQQNTPATGVEVDQSPRWWPVKRLPTLTRFITIEVRYE